VNLLFIHGAGGTKSKWRAMKDFYGPSQYRMVDLPGHGENQFDRATSIQEYADHLKDTIQEDTIVVGHSMGGLIALELAERSEKVKGIVLAASCYETPVHSKILDRLKNGEFPESLFYASYGKETSEQLLQEEKREISWVSTEISYIDFHACDQYQDGKEKLSSLSIPVCAILGEKDRLLPEGAADLLKRVNPSIKVTEIKGAGHFIMLEKPNEFSQSLNAFVDEVEAKYNY